MLYPYYRQLKEAHETQENIKSNEQLWLQAPYAKDVMKTIRRDIYVLPPKDIEIAWCKWKEISIVSPECEWFRWFTITFSISNEKFFIRDGNFFDSYEIFSDEEEKEKRLEKTSGLKGKLCNKNKLFEWLRLINEIMESCWLPTDSNIDNDDSWWRLKWYRAIEFIKRLVSGKKGLKQLESASLWLNDSKMYENNNFQACIDFKDWIIDDVWENRSAYMLLEFKIQLWDFKSEYPKRLKNIDAAIEYELEEWWAHRDILYILLRQKYCLSWTWVKYNDESINAEVEALIKKNQKQQMIKTWKTIEKRKTGIKPQKPRWVDEWPSKPWGPEEFPGWYPEDDDESYSEDSNPEIRQPININDAIKTQ